MYTHATDQRYSAPFIGMVGQGGSVRFSFKKQYGLVSVVTSQIFSLKKRVTKKNRSRKNRLRQ